MRTSSYVTYVVVPDDGVLLFHGYTGAVDRVSAKVAAFLRALEDSTPPPRPLHGEWTQLDLPSMAAVRPSDETVRLLQTRGYLTDRTRDDEEVLVRKIASKLHETPLKPQYVLMPTYDCNLRCAYCFQDHMRTDQRYRHLLTPISRGMIDRFFLAMPELEKLHQVANPFPRTVGFFGGEPLMSSNREAITHIVEQARRLGPTSFWAITNGTDLHAYRGILSPEKLRHLQITLDGTPADHDTRRIYANGSGSFDRISENITMALNQGVSVSVRLNVDRVNIRSLPALAEMFESFGWLERDNFSAYAAPLHAANDNVVRGNTYDSAELSTELAALRMTHQKVAYIDGPSDDLKAMARRVFSKEATFSPQASFCGAHTSMYVIDPFGDLYACWERTGDPGLRIGHIQDNGTVTLNSPMHNLWRGRTIAKNDVCNKCKLALSCGGGCAVLAAARHNGNILTNHCDGYAKRFREAIREEYLENQRGGRARGVGVPASLCR